MDEAKTGVEQQLDGNGGEFGEPQLVEGDGVPKEGIEAPADGSPVQLGETNPLDGLPVGKLKVPENTNGQYVVIASRKPKRGQRAQYVEVACVEAGSVEQAKRIVLEEGRSPRPLEERSPVARALLTAAAEGRGVLLRAVPAMHWPGEVEPTTFVRPEPVLKIG